MKPKLSKICVLACTAMALALAGAEAHAAGGQLVRIVVHGRSLEKNVTGESSDRNVSVYLPPSYGSNPGRRYPALYLLHGIGDTDEIWTSGAGPWQSIVSVMDLGIAEGRYGEMIVVAPDERTRWFGSFYVDSAATGNWEEFTVAELVAHVDRTYRTIASAGGRGIAGHSMGGSGALRLAMKHPEVFSVAYGMNPAVAGWGGDLTGENPAFAAIRAATSFDDLTKPTPEDPRSEYKAGLVTVAQAFSPNPSKPPFFADMPFDVENGRLVPSEPAHGKWDQVLLANVARRHQDGLRTLRGLRFDSGYDDRFTHIPVSCRALSAELSALGVPHVFEEYNGDHTNRMWGRTGRMATEVIPYFWMLLESGGGT